jgi:hypothetical protein
MRGKKCAEKIFCGAREGLPQSVPAQLAQADGSLDTRRKVQLQVAPLLVGIRPQASGFLAGRNMDSSFRNSPASAHA